VSVGIAIYSEEFKEGAIKQVVAAEIGLKGNL
jgi:hypothetical protein